MTPSASDTADAPWLSIVGIGEDGLAGLAPRARDAIDRSCLVWGGQRHLDLADINADRRHVWPSPMTDALDDILAQRGSHVTVLATGDPFHYGVGSLLANLVPIAEIEVFPAPSAFTLAAARLGWALQSVDCMTIHGRPLERVRPALQDGRRLMVLSWDGTSPTKLAQYLVELGFGSSELWVMEAMGGSRERLTHQTAHAFDLTDIDPINLMAIKCRADAGATGLALTPGRPELLFDHDGQITKSPVRAMTLAALAPRPGEMLWDVGAGSGSIAAEWLLSHPSCEAIGMECDPVRTARIESNMRRLGLDRFRVITGDAGAVPLPDRDPDAIFIGGGLTGYEETRTFLERLRSGGRLVANSVTLETEALLIQLHHQFGGDLLQLSLSKAETLGRFRGWRTALPIVQWQWTKP